jgi:hypothetical protein
MKKTILIKSAFTFLLIFTCSFLNGQVPQAFSFQGMALDAASKPVANKNIALEIKILKSTINGVNLYTERHLTKTSEQGLYSISVGKGNVVSGTFAKIDWAATPLFLSTSIDINGGSNFILIGASELLSVPYSLIAGEVSKPKIYISSVPINKTILLTNGEESNGQSFIYYFYQWIDGKPENVFVDIKGLPNNIGIRTTTRQGYQLPIDINNISKTDTIIGGVVTPGSMLYIINKAVKIPEGTYPLKLVFRTKNVILDSLAHELFVRDDAFADCVPRLPSNLHLKQNSCEGIVQDTVANIFIKIDRVRNNEISITDPFNDGKVIRAIYSNGCTVPPTIINLARADNSKYRIDNVMLTISKSGLVFDYTYTSKGPPIMTNQCKITY